VTLFQYAFDYVIVISCFLVYCHRLLNILSLYNIHITSGDPREGDPSWREVSHHVLHRETMPKSDHIKIRMNIKYSRLSDLRKEDEEGWNVS